MLILENMHIHPQIKHSHARSDQIIHSKLKLSSILLSVLISTQNIKNKVGFEKQNNEIDKSRV